MRRWLKSRSPCVGISCFFCFLIVVGYCSRRLFLLSNRVIFVTDLVDNYYKIKDDSLDKNSNIKYDSFDFIGSLQSDINFTNSKSVLGGSLCLFNSFRQKMKVYLLALQDSTRIISLPSSLSSDLRTKCSSLGPVKQSISLHPHSLELHFTDTLMAMSYLSSESKPSHLMRGERDGEGFVDGDRDDITNSAVRGKPNCSKKIRFSPLWKAGNVQPDRLNLVSDPLFFYVAALPYHVIYCTTKKNNKEDWSGRDPYWESIANYLLEDNKDISKNQMYSTRVDFMKNLGQEFLIPASHPQSGPSRIHPYSVSYLQRATFLKTDFDISGSDSKDIIVPYYTMDSGTPIPFDETSQHWCVPPYSLSISSRPLHIFFAGSDNPKKGYRTLFLQKLHSAIDAVSTAASGLHQDVTGAGESRVQGLWSFMTGMNNDPATFTERMGDIDNKEIFFALKSSSLTTSQYQAKLLEARYCLILRGDTTSSKRLFSAIAAGCIPVIISDGLRLPYSSILDYSTFTLSFSESIVHDLTLLLSHLRAISLGRYSHMRCALADARQHLLYEQRHHLADGSSKRNGRRSVLNPVTLILVEALIRREEQCLAAQRLGTPTSNMCQKVMLRLDVARETVAGCS